MGFNILDLLLPRETKFFTFLNQQVDSLIEGCKVFNKLVANIEQLSEDDIKKKLSIIKDCELNGDKMEVTIIKELNETFITPLDREDIHLIVINVDKALDILTSISRKFEIYNIRKVPLNVVRFSEIIVNIAQQLGELMRLLETKKNIDDHVKKLHTLENDGDYLFHISMAELFNEQNNPIDIIKFKEVYEHLEYVIDSIDYVGKLIRGIKVKAG
jgi:uncharacterized protein